MGVARRSTTADSYAPSNDEDSAYTPEDEDDTTRSGSVARRGWGAAKKVKAAASDFNDFKVEKETALVKFLEDEPFDSYAQHWVDEVKDGKKSWICLEKKCPLCAVGNKRRAMALFNVVSLSAEGEPVVQVLEAGPMLTDIIEENHNDRGGPLSKHYWTLRKTGGTGNEKVKYFMAVVKASELAEDFGLDPDEIKASLTGLKPFDDTYLKRPAVEDLEEIRDKYLSR